MNIIQDYSSMEYIPSVYIEETSRCFDYHVQLPFDFLEERLSTNDSISAPRNKDPYAMMACYPAVRKLFKQHLTNYTRIRDSNSIKCSHNQNPILQFDFCANGIAIKLPDRYILCYKGIQYKETGWTWSIFDYRRIEKKIHTIQENSQYNCIIYCKSLNKSFCELPLYVLTGMEVTIPKELQNQSFIASLLSCISNKHDKVL